MTRYAILLLIIWLCLASTSYGRDLYVSNVQGDDQFNGRAAFANKDGTGPVRTISRALRLARPGDEIIVDNTEIPYRECLTIGGRSSGRPNQPLVIHGNGATLDGSVPVPEGVWEHVTNDIFRYRPRRQTYLMLFYDQRPLDEKSVSPHAIAPPRLETRQWCFFQTHVYFRVEPGRVPDDYQLTQTGHAAGITLYRTHDVIVSDLIIQGYQLDGVNAHDLVQQIELIGLTCRGNGRSGISIGGASEAILEDCLLGNNGRTQFRLEGPATARVNNSQILETGVPRFQISEGRLFLDGRQLPGPPSSILPIAPPR